ncbi:hypothetical protein ONE63_002329 [Megalurothrips usitatus]|uniref:Chitin-binding type-2 domain-containing protein n=1 Tax=Megalurothrips usitatus TaxID=439358 RepID=A0AAV7XCB7_9NEOP|nr:hypothetical protein ONE63_002329 [Megalurothrips usitatus]
MRAPAPRPVSSWYPARRPCKPCRPTRHSCHSCADGGRAAAAVDGELGGCRRRVPWPRGPGVRRLPHSGRLQRHGARGRRRPDVPAGHPVLLRGRLRGAHGRRKPVPGDAAPVRRQLPLPQRRLHRYNCPPKHFLNSRCGHGLCLCSGQLPDPFDCTRYHVCRRGAAWTYTCDVAPSTVYRHASGRCEPPALAPCTSITCSGDGDDRLQLYGPDNSVGFRCEGAGNATAILCPANHRVDVGGSADSPACVRYCPRDGRQPVANDKSLYYECLALPDGSLSRPVLRECPEGSVFDADEERCRVLQDS